MIDYEVLCERAILARESAYAPYSGFKVGASLLTGSGKIYSGCNVENSSFGATICAERVAFGSAMADNERDFCAIAIVGALDGRDLDFTPPCGICLQVMSELCDEDFEVILINSLYEHKIYKLGELLPNGFRL
ncbi:MAG: cytidine deaminase [Clostridia bacterium]|nr:cytidine deaminase [Clostridia bacterium]MBR2296658.1 cytidine deaminase [Clostridia bacterium]